MFVYLITNTINGKRYVGQTSVSLEQRWRQHKCDAETGDDRHLYQSIRKYGFEKFEIKPLVIVGSKKEMDYYEKKLIDVWDLRNPDKGYNLTTGGEGSPGRIVTEETKNLLKKIAKETGRIPPSRKGCKLSESEKQRLSQQMIGNTYRLGCVTSEDTKEKLSKVNTGKILSEEHKQKIAASHFGIRHTPEVTERIRLQNLGRKHSVESSLKKSSATKGRPKSEETRQRMKDAWKIRRLKLKAKEIGGQQ